MGNGNKTNEMIQAKLKNPIIGDRYNCFPRYPTMTSTAGSGQFEPLRLVLKVRGLNFQDLRPSCMDNHLCSSKFFIAEK